MCWCVLRTRCDGVIVLDVGVIDVRCCVDEYECVGG